MAMDWAALELRHADLGDARLNQRLVQIVSDLADKPTQSVPQACGTWAATKAAYRFWDNPAVRAEAIREAHYRPTVARAQTQPLTLVIQDTTELDYSDHPATKNLGYLDNKKCQGLKVHSVMAVSAQGVPLGLLHQQVWIREPEQLGKRTLRRQRATADKESQRWLDGLTALTQELTCPVLMMADREADIYDLFALPRPDSVNLLIRACHNRKLEAEAGYLLTAIAQAKVQGTWEVELKGNPKRPTRDAILSLRYLEVSVEPPRHAKKRAQKKPVSLCVVSATEENPPAGEDAVSWTLLTTLRVGNLEEAKQIVNWYKQRWLIERYHYVLKSGCGLEKLQLEKAERLEKALATYTIVAWRVLWLTYAAREQPLESCEGVLAEHEWKALYCKMKKTPQDQPSELGLPCINLPQKKGGPRTTPLG